MNKKNNDLLNLKIVKVKIRIHENIMKSEYKHKLECHLLDWCLLLSIFQPIQMFFESESEFFPHSNHFDPYMLDL